VKSASNQSEFQPAVNFSHVITQFKIISKTGSNSPSDHSFSFHLAFVCLKLSPTPTNAGRNLLEKKTNYVLLLAGTNKIPCFHRQQARHMINLLLI